ncbi:DUF3253 domain-containing protein [Sphingomonas montana]|uniref:DUF3253 domain-containing protein n=1 Tax=Sphingomonas montana TaxID=1843236 RepID=UPI00096FEB6D|nr:DUF3253 domain-containing protein [Sphingomonas montana]
MSDPRAATLSLLAHRAPDATICPSEVARAIATDWRGAMPAVHAAIDGLVRDGLVQLSWKGRPLETRSGPYRIARLTVICPGLDAPDKAGRESM